MWPYAELSTDAKIGVVGALSVLSPLITWVVKQLFTARTKNSARRDSIEDQMFKLKDDIIAEQKQEYTELKAEYAAYRRDTQSRIEALQALLDHARGIK